jgi:hypothetical protein
MYRKRIAQFSIIALCVTVLYLNKRLLHWITATDEVPVEDGMQSTTFWGSHWRRVIGNEKNFWQICALSLSSAALISLTLLQMFRRSWHKEDEREERLEELEIITQQSEVFVQEMMVRMEHMQQANKEHCTEFQKQMDLLKKEIRRKETPNTDFQNVMDIVKTAKAGDGRCDDLKNQVDLLEKATRAEEERHAQFQKQINGIKMLLGRWFSMTTEQMAVHPTSMEYPEM